MGKVPTSAALSTTGRLLSLLSLLQVRRDWPGELLAQRLAVSGRTVRRDVDRLRELGYPVRAIRGPEGGYRLEPGAQLPPLLFDDGQALAVALALQGAALLGAGIADDAARALDTLRELMPARLRARLDQLTPVAVADHSGPRLVVDPDVLVAISAAITSRTQLRFDYQPISPDDGSPDLGDGSTGPPVREVEAHHLLARAGRWYLIAWNPARQDWRVYRVDRMTPRIPGGPRFAPRQVPVGDPAAFLTNRFTGSRAGNRWPCQGEVILALPATRVTPFAGDGVVEALDASRCRLRTGSWSWPGLAAQLALFDTEIEVVGPDELRSAFAELAHRAQRAATPTTRPSTRQTRPRP